MAGCHGYEAALTPCHVVQQNNLQMIVRAHECVMDGFERFAQGHLITLFSATNYCGTANNAGTVPIVHVTHCQLHQMLALVHSL